MASGGPRSASATIQELFSSGRSTGQITQPGRVTAWMPLMLVGCLWTQADPKLSSSLQAGGQMSFFSTCAKQDIHASQQVFSLAGRDSVGRRLEALCTVQERMLSHTAVTAHMGGCSQCQRDWNWCFLNRSVHNSPQTLLSIPRVLGLLVPDLWLELFFPKNIKLRF